MFNIVFCINVFMGLVLVPHAVEAAAEIPRIETGNVLVHRVDLTTLTDRDKRRLDFYASRIIEEITEISALEDTGDAGGVDSKLATTRTMAERFTISSQDLGLSADEARQYFLVHLMGNFSGQFPEVLMGSAGIFDLNLLFVPTSGSSSTASATTGGYIDLLRNETIGGVAPSE